METVINNKSKKQFRGRESSQDNTSETVSSSQLPALNNLTPVEKTKLDLNAVGKG